MYSALKCERARTTCCTYSSGRRSFATKSARCRIDFSFRFQALRFPHHIVRCETATVPRFSQRRRFRRYTVREAERKRSGALQSTRLGMTHQFSLRVAAFFSLLSDGHPALRRQVVSDTKRAGVQTSDRKVVPCTTLQRLYCRSSVIAIAGPSARRGVSLLRLVTHAARRAGRVRAGGGARTRVECGGSQQSLDAAKRSILGEVGEQSLQYCTGCGGRGARSFEGVRPSTAGERE